MAANKPPGKITFIYMKNYLSILATYLLINSPTFSQHFDWIYRLENEECCTYPARMYIDKDGGISMNLYNYDYQDTISHGTYSLLSLNSKGQFAGRTYVNFLNKIGTIMPMGHGRYLTSSYFRNSDLSVSHNARLYDVHGELIKEGPEYSGNSMSGIPVDNGFVLFTNPPGGFTFSSLIVSKFNSQLAYHSDTVSLMPLFREGKGIMSSTNDAHYLTNNSLIVPFHYGVDQGGHTIGPDNGVVACIKRNNILWKYPDTLSKYRIEAIATDNNSTWVIFQSKRGYKQCIHLDSEGKEIFSARIRLNSDIKDLEIHIHDLLILTTFGLLRYSPKCELIKEYNFQENDLGSFNEIQHYADNTYILSGTYRSEPFVGKLIFDENEIPPDLMSTNTHSDGDKVSETTYKIRSINVNQINDELVMVNLFPNPSSISITIEFKSGFLPGDKYQITLTSMNGNIVQQTSSNASKIELDISNLAPGTYYYRIYLNPTDVSKSISGQFIKI